MKRVIHKTFAAYHFTSLLSRRVLRRFYGTLRGAWCSISPDDGTSYTGAVATFSYPVSHRLERAQTLRGLRAGTLTRDEACDASFLLRTAATFHGTITNDACPVCESPDLREVLWVHGEELGRATNSARSMQEIEKLADSGLHFGVHTVEVCPACGWNHILETRDVGPTA